MAVSSCRRAASSFGILSECIIPSFSATCLHGQFPLPQGSLPTFQRTLIVLLVVHLSQKKLQQSRHLAGTRTFRQITLLELYKVAAIAQKMDGDIEVYPIHCQITTSRPNAPSCVYITDKSL